MQGLAVILFPVLLMLFALAMERVEQRLHKPSAERDALELIKQNSNAGELSI
jgi:hypothetical protein